MTNPQQIMDWYNHNAALEHNRLNACRLEFSISMRVINQCLERLGRRLQKPLRILDLGGGTGRYGKCRRYVWFSDNPLLMRIYMSSCRACAKWPFCYSRRYIAVRARHCKVLRYRVRRNFRCHCPG